MAHRGELDWALGRELDARRVQLGLSQEEVARRAGISRSVYQRLERAKQTMTPEQLVDIGEALETTGGTLLDAAKALVDSGKVPSYAERAAMRLDAAVGYRRKPQ